MGEPEEAALLAVNARLLDAIAAGDWATYEELCDPALTCFEPEAKGHLVAGMAFHRFYFGLGQPAAPPVTTMASPAVRWLGPDAAVVACVRLVQRAGPAGPTTSAHEETRVWTRRDGRWLLVHFHRSPAG